MHPQLLKMERALKGKEVMMINPRELPKPKQCPRCESTDTKFCYFNNYSQSQPRHFCRACCRHWTEWGRLRNVPHGGGSYRRGNKCPRTALAAMSSRPVISTGPEVIAPMPPPPLFFGGGSIGSEDVMAAVFQPFHPGCAAMMADFQGFPAGDQGVPFNPLLMLPGFFNLPIHPQLVSPFDPIMMIQQQMSVTVFTSTTTVSTAGTGNGEGYWNEFNNAGEGGGPRPPMTSASI